MDRTIRTLLIAAMLVPASYGQVTAQTLNARIQSATTVTPEDWVYKNIGTFARRKNRIQDIVKAAEAVYQRQNTTGLGISKDSYALADAIALANRRSSQMRNWFRQDLNANGKVSKDELESVFGVQARSPLRSRGTSVMPTPSQIKEILDKLVAKVLADDLDGDEQVSFTEALAAIEKKLSKRRHYRRHSNRIPLSMDADGNAVVSLAEFTDVVSKVLSEIDTNEDRLISKTELEAIKQRIRQARQATNQAQIAKRKQAKLVKALAVCNFPKPARDEKVVLVGTYHGAGLSNVSLGGDDVHVSVGNIEIEAGEKPLFVVLTSFRSMIWRFSGDVGRVARVVVTARTKDSKGTPRVGVIGIADDRVSIPGRLTSRMNCLKDFTKPRSSDALKANNALELMIGRRADTTIATYTTATMRLPSGTNDKAAPFAGQLTRTKKGPSAGMWQAAMIRWPSGLIDIVPSKVVSGAPAKRFEVLAKDAGIAMLLQDGSLEGIGETLLVTNGYSTVYKSAGSLTIEMGRDKEDSFRQIIRPAEFRITRQMSLPAGLCGSSGHKFILPKGIPTPKSHECLPCILSEETGQPVKGARCR